MPKIADTNFILNRREMYLDNPDQEAQGNRVTVIPPEVKEQFIQSDQYFPDKSIDGSKIGPIVDTGNSGITSIGEDSAAIRFWAGTTFANRATAPFRVDRAGNLTATSATISGTITATTGSIGGFTIGTDYIRDAADSMGLASTVTGGDDVRFWAGTTFASRNSAPFRVTESGAVTASTITATGTINALAGYIGSTTALVYESTGINTGVTGHIRGGQTVYDTGIGYFLGYTPASAVYQFSIGEGGNPTNNLRWDGVNLYINGRLLATDPLFGDGSDGDVVINESATLARDMFYNKLTIAQAGAAALTFNPTADGVARRTIASDTWSDIRGGAGTSADSVSQTLSINLVGSAAGSTWEILRRGILVFDTSSIPDNAVITSATLQLYAQSKRDVASQSISIATRTDPGTIGASDFDIGNWTMARQATDIAISAITTSAYNSFTLNAAGLASISKTGNTTFGVILSGDIDNSEPTWSASVQPEVVFNSTDSINKPILSVTYSLQSTFNTPTGTSGDGYARCVSANSTFASLRSNSGTASNSSDANITIQLDTGTTTDRFDRIDRGILTFDTSALPDDATVLSATLSLYVNSKTDNLSQSIAIGTRTNPGVIANADFNIANWTMTAQATAKTITSITTGAFNVWTMNATGVATIQAAIAGTTVFGVLLSADIDNTAPTWSSNVQADINFDSADGTNKPLLTVVYRVNSPIVNPAGYRIFAKKFIALKNGSIIRSGNNGGNGNAGNAAAGSTRGTGGAAATAAAALASGSIFGSVIGAAGVAGGDGALISSANSAAGTNGNNGTAASSSVGSTGAAGVAGSIGGKAGAATGTPGAAGTAGTAGTRTTAAASPRNVVNMELMFDSAAATLYKGSSAAGGSGGSSGGCSDGSNNANSGGGGGAASAGAPGGPGGIIFLASPTITIDSGASISAPGGNGGNGGIGGAGGNANGASRKGGGGGGGGAAGSGGDGGIIALLYTTYTNSGTVSAAAGTAGTLGTFGAGGVGSGGAVSGQPGVAGLSANAGNAGVILQLSLN